MPSFPPGSNAQNLAPIIYRVRVPQPDTPYAHVEAIVPAGGRATIELMMPVLRPVELGPFDFEEPPTTGTPWIAEGVTSYSAPC